MWDGLSVEKTDNCGFSVEIHIPIPPSQLLGLEVYNEKENRLDFPERKKYKLLSMIQGPSPNGFIVERIDSFQNCTNLAHLSMAAHHVIVVSVGPGFV
jgi:hypothetical protein